MQFDPDTGARIADYTGNSNYSYGIRGQGLSTDATQTSLQGRGMYVNTWLPDTLAANGVRHGDTIKVSWKQKSSAPGKGARVYIRYWKLDTNNPAEGWWSSNTTSGDGEYNTDQRVIVSEVNTWEDASFTFTVDPNWNLTKNNHALYGDRNIHALLRIHGDGGDFIDGQYPEGTLEVKNLEITVVDRVDISASTIHEYTIDNFQPNDTLELTTTNISTEKRGFLAKIDYKGTVYKTGDVNQGAYEDPETGDTINIALPGKWKTQTNYGNVKYLGLPEDDTIDPKLQDCQWLWSGDDINEVKWNWFPNTQVGEFIWNYPDPNLHDDAVSIPGWSDGFNPFHYGGSVDEQNRLDWHSGWIGYHAKWVRDEGQFGTCMKFIDRNSEFTAPNHVDFMDDYNEYYPTQNTGGTSNLTHRWMMIYSRLPSRFSSQGIMEGDLIRISWWQKSDTLEKGAQVGLRHKASNGTTDTYGEFLQTIPCTVVDIWEKVSYTAEVDSDWDLTKESIVEVWGNQGPEGMLWVEGLIVERVSDPQNPELLNIEAMNKKNKREAT